MKITHYKFFKTKIGVLSKKTQVEMVNPVLLHLTTSFIGAN